MLENSVRVKVVSRHSIQQSENTMNQIESPKIKTKG